MIARELAQDLRDAGLLWSPANGDRFAVPDRNLDDQVFWISDMTIEVKQTAVGAAIAFNGTTEWALDAIMLHEVIWLPHEHQLRELLGRRFVSLDLADGELRCVVEDDGHRTEYRATSAADAYGRALLHHLRHG